MTRERVSIRFRLAPRAYDAPPCGPSVRVVPGRQTKPEKYLPEKDYRSYPDDGDAHAELETEPVHVVRERLDATREPGRTKRFAGKMTFAPSAVEHPLFYMVTKGSTEEWLTANQNKNPRQRQTQFADTATFTPSAVWYPFFTRRFRVVESNGAPPGSASMPPLRYTTLARTWRGLR